MDKKEIAAFFDSYASSWDADMIKEQWKIDSILDVAQINEGTAVLDVACGTGVLFPDYLSRQVAGITAIDISAEMVRITKSKFPQAEVICGDVETTVFDRKFDCVMVYNAFPHFPNPENLIRVLSALLKSGGTLTVAHGMSRAAIDSHHKGAASKVSVGLMHEDDLATIFEKYLTVTTKISNEQMYQVTGVKN